MNRLIDRFQRVIEYIRVSVTDRCNLNCVYCSPDKRFNFIPREEILTYEEIIKILTVGAKYGIKKVRITGGEPLLRKDISKLIIMISSIKEIKTIALTTNGVLLELFAEELKKAGLNRINISLDTIEPTKYERITGNAKLPEIIAGIKLAKDVGLDDIRLNTVVIRGLNSDGILELIDFAYKMDIISRFIEYMPNEFDNKWNEKLFTRDEILKSIREKYLLEELGPLDSSSPTKYYNIKGRNQEFGIISPISHNFCKDCNRIRLTADGNLISCLLSGEKTDLKTLLRNQASDEELIKTIKLAIEKKGEKGKNKIQFMQKIGG